MVSLAARLILLLRAFEERKGEESLSGGLGAGVSGRFTEGIVLLGQMVG